MKEIDLAGPGGRILHAYDTAPEGGEGRLAVVWHHGTPNIGAPPAPLSAAAADLGLRWIGYDRPGYGGSTARPGRDVASAAADVAAVADALGVDRCAVVGHSGGGPHALACAALLPDRVVAAVSLAGLAPYGAEGLDWFGGMARSGVESLGAAVEGREAKERHATSGAEYDPEFTEGDLAALSGEWSWFASVVGPAVAGDARGPIDDDLAYVAPWGCDPATIEAPVLLVHGDRDRIAPSAHSHWLAGRIPTAELWRRPDDGHISVLTSGGAALTWLRHHVPYG